MPKHAKEPGKSRKASTAPSFKEKVLSRIDRLTDLLSPQELRRISKDVQRRVGLTRSGVIAILASILTWLAAYIVAGKALYLFAYGIFILVVMSYVLAPRKLKLEGVRAGLFPRAQEGDRLEVEVELKATRRVAAC